MDGHKPWIISDTFDFNHIDRIDRALLDHSFWTSIKKSIQKKFKLAQFEGWLTQVTYLFLFWFFVG